MKIIVDTNIVFSAILNSSSRIGKILINSKEHFQFYTCDFLRAEVFKHRSKIQTLTGLSKEEKAKNYNDFITLKNCRNYLIS